MASLGTMIEQIDGLLDTGDLTKWEEGFVEGTVERYRSANKDTRSFTPKQVECIERIWGKHFAG